VNQNSAAVDLWVGKLQKELRSFVDRLDGLKVEREAIFRVHLVNARGVAVFQKHGC
jgi:hypothetical protein